MYNMCDGTEYTKTPLEELDQDQVKEILALAWHDPVFFCKYFLGDLFSRPMPWVHRGILAILTRKCAFLPQYGDMEKIVSNFVYERDGEVFPIFTWDGEVCSMNLQQYTLLMIPRGFSKTTIAGIAYPIYNVVFQELGFAAYVSETARHAEQQLENVKRQLESNPKIKYFFGQLKPGMQDEQRWRQDFFETLTGMAMVARGRGGQVRGLNHNGQRPRVIIVDDVEDKESVLTPEQRQKTKTWAYGDLMPALPALDSTATMIALGTLLHPDSLLMTWAADPQWTVIRFGSYDKQGELLWPENMDEVKLKKLEESAVLSNTLPEFYMERHSVIRLDRDRDFKVENMQYGAPEADEVLMQALYVDPAIGKRESNDRCTFTVAAIGRRGRHYVRHSAGRVGIPVREQVDTIFELYQKYRPQKVGIEANAYQQALVHLVQEEMFRRKVYFEVTPVTNVTDKKLRIKGVLQARFAAKYVWFCGRFPELETQLINFPHARRDDDADGLAGAISLLDAGAFMAQPDEGKEGEVVDLEEEIGGDWRKAV